MAAGRDPLNAFRELLEVILLRGQHRMRTKERDDRLKKMVPPAYDVPIQVLTVVIPSIVRDDLSNTEELTQSVETRKRFVRLASPRTRVKPASRSCSRFELRRQPGGRSRSRSILLRLQNQQPTQA